MDEFGNVRHSTWKLRRIELDPDREGNYEFPNDLLDVTLSEIVNLESPSKPHQLVNGKFAMHNGIAHYSGYKTSYILDLVVISNTYKECEEQFNIEKQKSDEKRHELMTKLNPKVLEAIKSFKGVKLLFGRGTVFDESRIVSPDDDIDLILFIDSTDSDLEDELKRLVDNITEVNDTIGISYGVFAIKVDGPVQGSDSIIKKGNPVISFDIIPVIDDERILSNVLESEDKYAKESIKSGTIIFADESHSITKVVREYNLKGK